MPDQHALNWTADESPVPDTSLEPKQPRTDHSIANIRISTFSSQENQHTDHEQEASRALGGDPQQKLSISPPNASAENEAKSVATRIEANGPVELLPGDQRSLPIAGPALSSAPNLGDLTNRALGSTGVPIARSIRAPMESRFGYDFSNVRIHANEGAAESAQALQAQAFTFGNDIVFGRNQYSPQTAQGKALLAHELTHVVQQTPYTEESPDVEGYSHLAEPSASSDPQTLYRQADSAAAPPVAVPGSAAPSGSLASQLPPQIDLNQMSLSFRLPGGKALTGDWNDLSTTNPTIVTLTMTPTVLQMAFSPALLIDAQWPVSDMEWSGVTFSFATASITAIPLADTQSLAVSAQGRARSAISAFFMSSLAGSPVTTPGYNPLTDTGLAGTLSRIKTNFENTPSSGGDVKAADVTNIALSASIGLRAPITEGAGEGSLMITGGATISVHLAGSADDIKNGPPPLEEVSISPTSMIVQKNGEDVAKIGDLTIARGGTVSVSNLTLLGSAKKAAGTESALRTLVLILALSSGGPEDRPAVADKNPALDAEVVQGVTKKLIQDALTKAVRELILQNADAIPGLDLPSIFGVPQKGDFPIPKGKSKAA